MIDFDVGTPNPHGFIAVRAIEEGATDLQAFDDAIAERYPNIHLWRSKPAAHSEPDFEGGGTRLWCSARFIVRDHPQQ